MNGPDLTVMNLPQVTEEGQCNIIASITFELCHFWGSNVTSPSAQVKAVQGATASAFLTEPAWGIAQTITLHAKSEISLSAATHRSTEHLCRTLAYAAMLAKQQVQWQSVCLSCINSMAIAQTAWHNYLVL